MLLLLSPNFSKCVFVLLHRYRLIDHLVADDSGIHRSYGQPLPCQMTEALSNPFDVNLVDSHSVCQGDSLKVFS